MKREEIHLMTAVMWSTRSKCKRLQVGCVITTEDLRRVLSVGYNGIARGTDLIKECTGQEGNCGCLHAEDNAVAMVDGTIPNKHCFLTHDPCGMCAQRLIQANVSSVTTLCEYRSREGIEIFTQSGGRVRRLDHLLWKVESLLSMLRQMD